MNILILTTHLNTGGITSYVLSLAKGLKSKGHNIYVASSGGELLPRLIEEGISHIFIPIKTKQEISINILISFFKLLKFIREKDIGFIHANTRVTQVLGSLSAKFSGRPYISTCHGFFKVRFFRRFFGCWGIKVIAISQQVKEHLIKDFRIEENRIRLVNNGIDLNRFRVRDWESKVERKRVLGLAEGPVIGIIARLSDVKGHIYLIQAMKVVLQKLPNAQLLIVGEGKMKETLVNLTVALGIEKSVFFVPTVMDTSLALEAMDVFVMPSLAEGLGLSLMEAMAAGVAVVGSDVGGIKTLIQHGFNGLLVKPRDITGIAAALLELLQNEQKRKYLGENARNFICQNFSLERMICETERVYLECLAAKD